MLSIGIVGLPNVGKSTLFNALLKKQQALAANYPFATIEPNVGVVPVPDERLKQLAQLVKNEEKMSSSPPLVPTMIRFVDIAGLVKGASQGEGLGNQFLAHIREADAVVEVVRVFEDENIIRSGAVDPKSDIEVVNTELILADLLTIQKSKIKNQNDRLKIGNSESEVRDQTLSKLELGLNGGKLVSEVALKEDERRAIHGLQLLTAKPILYVFNVSESQLSDGGFRGVTPKLGVTPSEPLVICAKVEAELSELTEAEQAEYLSQLGVRERGLDQVIRRGYEALGLISFLTAGPKEVRAWTINKGDKAPQAGGKIHSDFERGFVAAEVIPTDELLSFGSYKKAKELGKIRLEGKDYVVQDGDVIEFRFSV